MTWDAMSAAERDAVRVEVLKLLLPPSRAVLAAGRQVRRNPKFGWETEERRLTAEFEAMVRAALEARG